MSDIIRERMKGRECPACKANIYEGEFHQCYGVKTADELAMLREQLAVAMRVMNMPLEEDFRYTFRYKIAIQRALAEIAKLESEK